MLGRGVTEEEEKERGRGDGGGERLRLRRSVVMGDAELESEEATKWATCALLEEDEVLLIERRS